MLSHLPQTDCQSGIIYTPPQNRKNNCHREYEESFLLLIWHSEDHEIPLRYSYLLDSAVLKYGITPVSPSDLARLRVHPAPEAYLQRKAPLLRAPFAADHQITPGSIFSLNLR